MTVSSGAKEFLPQNISKPIAAGRATGSCSLANRGLTFVRFHWCLGTVSELNGVREACALSERICLTASVPFCLACLLTTPQQIARNLMIDSESQCMIIVCLKSVMVQVPRAVWDPSVQIDGCTVSWYEEQPLVALNLSCNCFVKLPAELAECVCMQTLNVCTNELQTLPESLSTMTALKLLDVSSNSLQDGTIDVIASIPNLAKLIVSDNPLSELPVQLGSKQRNHAEVIADRCKLATLPPGLAHAVGLRLLSCCGNRLDVLEPGLLSGACTAKHAPGTGAVVAVIVSAVTLSMRDQLQLQGLCTGSWHQEALQSASKICKPAAWLSCNRVTVAR